MKDWITIWNRLSGRQYTAVSQNSKQDEPQPNRHALYARSLRRKSSVVINQFFHNAIPVHASGKPKWGRRLDSCSLPTTTQIVPRIAPDNRAQMGLFTQSFSSSITSPQPSYVNVTASKRKRKDVIIIDSIERLTNDVYLDGLEELVDINNVRLISKISDIFTLMTMGLMGLVMGSLVLVLQPYEFIFKWKAILSEGGEIYEIWRSPPVDLFLKVYLFNITNHEAYMSRKDSTLKLQEIGPYVYKEFLEHGNVTFNDNGTMSTVPLHPLQFIPELSNGTEEDIVIMPNIALLSIANVMKDSAMLTRWGLNLIIRQTNSKPLVHMTAKEFMFGYKSSLVTLGNNVMPAWIKFERLGLIDRMYDFTGDYETVYTGETDIRLSGLIDKFNGNENLPHWKGSCANVQGSSDGAKFPSYIEPNDTLKFFRKSLCRSARMIRTGEKIVKGLYSYKYKFMEHELDNGIVNPENRCFCRQGYCLPYGLIDVTDCYYGFPIALSYPHFYESDPALLKPLEGMYPDKEKHESYFYIQPKSGLPVDLAFRFQINMALQDISKIDHVDGFSNLVLPLLWFEIGMYELPDYLNAKFFLYLNILPTMQEIMIYGLFLTGASCLVWSIIKILTYKPRKEDAANKWFSNDMETKPLNFLANERRSSLKTGKEMDVYLNTLLVNKDEDVLDPANLEELANLKEDIV